MVVKKRSGTFDVYQVEMSFKELMAVKETGRGSGDPIADEISKGIDWYFANEVAPPGVDEHPSKAAEKNAEAGAGGGNGSGGADALGAEADDILPAVEPEGGEPGGGPAGEPAGPGPENGQDDLEDLPPGGKPPSPEPSVEDEAEEFLPRR